jgi:hypothetical protein
MRKPFIVCLYAVAMGILEAAVVVYLRRIYYPGGFGFPLVAMDPAILRVEILREAMTIVMLATVALLAADRAWPRLMAFLIAFGVWDIVYYAGLKVFLDWPASLVTPDILFLIPSVWIGPVLAPVIVAATWVVAGLMLHRHEPRSIGMGWATAAAAMASALVIIASFLGPSPDGATQRFSWPLFLAGYGIGAGALARLVMRSRSARAAK